MSAEMKAAKIRSRNTLHILVILIAGLLSLSSCRQNKQASVIIIAADQLAFNSFLCGEEKATSASGLATLCKESIRFTNAYTTSIHSAAAMGSLLSGTYPFQHGLHRSFDRISSSKKLIQEFYKDRGYRTAFWSGKATILKKTGLSRGFELFDDFSLLNQLKYAMSFSEQSELFIIWALDSSKPFFSVIYNSEVESLNEGESQISNLENFDEKLGIFFNKLKEIGLWDSNYVIVIGLQGKSDYNRTNESIFSNLHTENSNVALFIKPPRDKGDEGIGWKSNAYITTADFGLSLIKTLVPNYQVAQNANFEIVDYSHFWKNNDIENLSTNSRKLVVETANTWKKNLELRYAIIDGNYLYIEGEKNQLFNKLTDGLETIDIAKTHAELVDTEFNFISEIRKEISAGKWTDYQPSIYSAVLANREYWSNPNNRGQLFQNEKKRLTKEKQTQPLSSLLVYYENPKLIKDELYDIARLNSYNLSLENIWGLWTSTKKWDQPKVTNEHQ